MLISWVYNAILRLIFNIKFQDISAGSRLVSKKLIRSIKLKSNSPFVGAELAIKAKLAGYKVGEIGIHTYPRTFGSGSSVSLKNILLTTSLRFDNYQTLQKLSYSLLYDWDYYLFEH